MLLYRYGNLLSFECKPFCRSCKAFGTFSSSARQTVEAMETASSLLPRIMEHTVQREIVTQALRRPKKERQGLALAFRHIPIIRNQGLRHLPALHTDIIDGQRFTPAVRRIPGVNPDVKRLPGNHREIGIKPCPGDDILAECK